MTWKNLLGGLALDTTLGELLEVMHGAFDGSEPLYVATPDDGEPLKVEGKVKADLPGQGLVRNYYKVVPTGGAAGRFVAAAPDRTALSIYNSATSSGLINMRLVNAGAQSEADISGTAYTVLLYPGDYWECPAKFVGEVWAFGASSTIAFVTEYF